MKTNSYYVTVNNLSLLEVSSDAIIIRPHGEKYYDHAGLIIHRHQKTKQPFVLLYDSSDRDHIDDLVVSVIREYPEEFPDLSDAFFVQVYYDMSSNDDRVNWVIV